MSARTFAQSFDRTIALRTAARRHICAFQRLDGDLELVWCLLFCERKYPAADNQALEDFHREAAGDLDKNAPCRMDFGLQSKAPEGHAEIASDAVVHDLCQQLLWCN